MSREYFSFSFSFVRSGGLIWLYSSPEVVAALNALNQRADVPSVFLIFVFRPSFLVCSSGCTVVRRWSQY